MLVLTNIILSFGGGGTVRVSIMRVSILFYSSRVWGFEDSLFLFFCTIQIYMSCKNLHVLMKPS